MKPGEIAELVDRGLELRTRIAEDSAELKKIETKLKAAGYEAGLEGDHEELKDANREGKRWLARGSAMILPVVFTSDNGAEIFSWPDGGNRTCIAPSRRSPATS